MKAKLNLANARTRFIITLTTVIFMVTQASTTQAQTEQQTKNVVLVHGAFADGSGWEAVFQILARKGYNVTIVQNPLRSLEDDVAATNLVLDRQDGPVVLVGHSWGGTVITQAGVHPKVAALVYVCGWQPDIGESTLDLFQSAPPAPENGVLPPDENGMVYYSKEKFHKGFAGDLPKEKADFLYASQGAFAAKGFATPVTVAAWRTKPSYGIIGTEDKSLNPEIARRTHKRAGTIITEIKGSHVVFMSQPQKVADVIERAAKGK